MNGVLSSIIGSIVVVFLVAANLIKANTKKKKPPLATKIAIFTKGVSNMSTPAPTVLDQGNQITLTAAGEDGKGNVIPNSLDPNTQLTWTPDVAGVAAISPTAGTDLCVISFQSAGTVNIAVAGKNLGGTVINGTIQVICKAALASQIGITASPETAVPTV